MRYKQLYLLISVLKPKSIIEIGTWNGVNAVNMITASGTLDAAYHGFDLFEEATSETDSEEFNVKKA